MARCSLRRLFCARKKLRSTVIIIAVFVCFLTVIYTDDLEFDYSVAISKHLKLSAIDYPMDKAYPSTDFIQHKNETVELHHEDTDLSSSQDRKRRLPKCIIIGTMKSGTKALIEFIGTHPKVKTGRKETFFFVKDENYLKGFDFYRDMMPFSNPGDITIEKTPDYFQSELARERIYRYDSSIKLLVTFKNPVTRAISDYRHYKERHSDVKENFQSFVTDKVTGELNLTCRAINVSIYVDHLQKWYSYFPKQQIHVVDGEKLITNPLKEIRRVEEFLGLEHVINSDYIAFNKQKGFYCMRSSIREPFECLPPEKGEMPNPYVDPSFLEKLRDFYHPYNEQLFKLVNQTFDWN